MREEKGEKREREGRKGRVSGKGSWVSCMTGSLGKVENFLLTFFDLGVWGDTLHARCQDTRAMRGQSIGKDYLCVPVGHALLVAGFLFPLSPQSGIQPRPLF